MFITFQTSLHSAYICIMNAEQIFSTSKVQTLAITTLYGLEEILAAQLIALGAKNVTPGNRVVHCEGNLKFIYSACLNLRYALRVLVYLDEFEATNPDELYDQAVKLPWQNLIQTNETFAINFAIHSDFFTHTKYASLKLKDAIVDKIRNEKGERPSIGRSKPDYQLLLHISDEFVSLYLDASGAPLNQRGYRDEFVAAPLNETLAAAIIKFTGWDGKSPLIDGMCGSGTIGIEAGFLARNIPAQWYRTWYGFKTWKNFQQDLWDQVKLEAKAQVTQIDQIIYCSDVSDFALKSAEANIANARLTKEISTQQIAFEEIEKPASNGTIILNPPYGERLNPVDINALYKRIGDTLKQNFDGWDAWIITSNKEALKHLGLRTAKRIKLYNGPLETRLVHYPLYRGTKKN